MSVSYVFKMFYKIITIILSRLYFRVKKEHDELETSELEISELWVYFNVISLWDKISFHKSKKTRRKIGCPVNGTFYPDKRPCFIALP